MQVGYPCLSLHGAKDQSDRESTINDFKTGVSNVLVATSIAARGLDVKDLVLVVNYEVPNHHEDYVHRVGRTGVERLLCSDVPAERKPLYSLCVTHLMHCCIQKASSVCIAPFTDGKLHREHCQQR